MGSLIIATNYGFDYTYGDFYFVCVMTFHSEFILLSGTILGVTFVSPPNKVTPNCIV